MNTYTSSSSATESLHDNMPAENGEFFLTPEQVSQHKQQLAQYRKTLAQNAGRTRLHTLIIEDQAFSRSLLHEVLHVTCSVSGCSNAHDGWQRYLEEAPDIVFLDIGLPDANGHVLADKIKMLDPQSYIVMVTASQDVTDVQLAKINRVDGFIVKPFNKQKIDAAIQRYLATHKTPAKAHGHT